MMTGEQAVPPPSRAAGKNFVASLSRAAGTPIAPFPLYALLADARGEPSWLLPAPLGYIHSRRNRRGRRNALPWSRRGREESQETLAPPRRARRWPWSG